jgi:hypothetical protein
MKLQYRYNFFVKSTSLYCKCYVRLLRLICNCCLSIFRNKCLGCNICKTITNKIMFFGYFTNSLNNVSTCNVKLEEGQRTMAKELIAGPHCGNRIAAKLLLVFLNFCCLSVDGRVTRETRGFLSSRNTSKKSNMFDFLPVLPEFLAILLPLCGRFSHRRC